MDALVADTARVRSQMLRDLNANIFADDGSYRPIHAVPLRARLSWIRAYFLTLWKAFKGVDLVEMDEDY